MGARKQRRDLLLEIERQRAEYLEARALLFAKLEKAPVRHLIDLVEQDKFSPWQQDRLSPLEKRFHECKKNMFLGLAKFLAMGEGGGSTTSPDWSKNLLFVAELSKLLNETHQDFACRGDRPRHQQSAALIKAETAIRAAVSAAQALSDDDRYKINIPRTDPVL